jgi:RND family efflux transporter MFP subunit
MIETHNATSVSERPSAAPDRREPETYETQRASGGRKRLVLIWLAPFALFAVLGAYSLAQRHSVNRALADQTTKNAVPFVTVVHAMPMPGSSELVLPGQLMAYVEAPIYARTSGYVRAWHKDIGSRVSKGDLLAEIDTPEVDSQLAQARADLSTAEANLGLSQTTATRFQDLIKTDSVSKQEVDNATGDLAAKKSTVQSAEANLHRLQDLESFKRVFAPFNGVIIQRNTDVGQLINAGNGGSNTALFVLAQVDPLRVYVAVPQSFAPSIHLGQEACLELQEVPGKSFCGKVARTADSIEANTRTLRTEVDVPNHSGTLLPGAYAQVHFGMKVAVSRLALPINTLLFRPEGTLIAVVGPDSKIQLKQVTVGRDLGSSVEAMAGVDTNDQIVLNPPDSLEQGETVHVQANPSSQGQRQSGSSAPNQK